MEKKKTVMKNKNIPATGLRRARARGLLYSSYMYAFIFYASAYFCKTVHAAAAVVDRRADLRRSFARLHLNRGARLRNPHVNAFIHV